ncbi:hypothetical protein ABW20_dc0110500 [Dactylellina cionopaga]|nr:hypothetical protein ABW20_dc0110500 [Dactylellina cionopaga]
MPMIDGVKYACEPCMRGHRSSKCSHQDRILIKVRKPGRPLSSCPHEAGSCSCEVASVAIPKISANCPCGTPPGIGKIKKEDKASKYDRSRAGSHASSSIPGTPASQPQMNMGYGFPNGFVPNMDSNDLISPMDQNNLWQTQGLNGLHGMNGMGGMGGMNNMSPFPQHMDLSSPGGPQFYPNDMPPGLGQVPMVRPPATKKSCCKPEPVNSSADGKNYIDATASGFPGIQAPPLPQNAQYGDFPQDQRDRRHTTETYRKRASVGAYPEVDMRQFAPGPDGRSTSVPNVALMNTGMMNGMPYGAQQLGPVSEEPSQNPAYTIYTAPRYTQKQILYMNTVREAHEKQQQEEAEAARRASQAGEHAQKMQRNCCPPTDNSGLGYALPHGQECGCGPNCSCVMCMTHPYNSATIEYIRNIHQTMQTPEHSSEEHSPSTQGFAHSVAGGADFTNGSVGVFGDVALDGMSDEKSMFGLQPAQLSPSAFIQLDYPLGNCSQQNGGCMCGEGCTCVGCLTHGGHNGVPLHMDAAMLSQPSIGEQPLDGNQDMSGPAGTSVGGDQKATPNDLSDNVWKTEESASGSGIQASSN